MFFDRWHALGAVLLAFAWPVKAQTTLLDFKGYPQEKDQWCWAATAQSVINSTVLNPSPNMLKTQCEVVEAAGQICTDSLTGTPKVALDNLLPAPYVAEDWQVAMPFDVLKSYLGSPDALPIPFGIHYCPQDKDLATCVNLNYSRQDNGSTHFLLVTGFSEDNGEQLVAIYDPWPKNEGNPALANGDPQDAISQPYKTQSRWVSYATFAVNQGSPPIFTDLGVPYMHLDDYPVMQPRVFGQLWRQTKLCGAGCSHPLDRKDFWSLGARVRFSIAMSDSRSAALLHLGVMQRRPGSSPNLQIAEPLPIVALDAASLVGAERSPISLLEAATARVVYPVVAGGVVRDAFILNRAVRKGQKPTWLEGGFANAQIVAQLVNARLRQPNSALQRSPFYLVSIPQVRVFLLAQGTGQNATLIALADRTDLVLSSREGDFVKAGASYPARVLMPVLRQAASRLHAG